MTVRRLAALLLGAAAMLLATPVLAAPPSPTPAATPDYSGEPWWVPASLQGQRLTAVQASAGRIDVATSSGQGLTSTDGGRTFAPGSAPVAPPPPDVHSGTDEWRISDGSVLHGSGGGAPAPDPGAPDLGGAAHLLAAPAATPGVVVAVSDAGVVWRRTHAGEWSRALVLLPRSVVGGTPSITALAAFTSSPPGGGTPVSVYLSTDGFSVLATQNGGTDWFRDGPGLPDSVLALATAPDLDAVLAATSDGLWVHHLRALPSVPQYPAPDLAARQRWIAAITVAACLGGGAALWLALERRPGRRGRVGG